MRQIKPKTFNGWRIITSTSAEYTYQMNPDIAPLGRPDYANQTVLESFSSVTPVGFTMSGLTTKFKKANPTVNTPAKVAVFLWNTSNNGTFVIHGQDVIVDQHGGFGDTSPFTSSATASGVGYILPQNYSCAGAVIGSYTIERRYTSGAIKVRKSGP